MSAMIQIHTHHSITGLQACELYCHICLCTGMRLYIDVLSAEQFLCTFSRQILYDIYAVTATVITMSGISFCIFNRQHAAHCRHDCMTDPVFRSNQLDVAVLSVTLSLNSGCDLRIYGFNIFHCVHMCPSFFIPVRAIGSLTGCPLTFVMCDSF